MFSWYSTTDICSWGTVYKITAETNETKLVDAIFHMVHGIMLRNTGKDTQSFLDVSDPYDVPSKTFQVTVKTNNREWYNAVEILCEILKDFADSGIDLSHCDPQILGRFFR